MVFSNHFRFIPSKLSLSNPLLKLPGLLRISNEQFFQEVWLSDKLKQMEVLLSF